MESIYYPLNHDRKEIRILHQLSDSSSTDILDCRLEIVSLRHDPKPQYEAISYCWGEYNGHETIRLNGIHFDVPKSAARVLRRFSEPDSCTLPLWIDAICINQTDVNERSSQVLMMSEIYSLCMKCLIWLGNGDASTNSTLRALEDIANNYSEYFYDDANTIGSIKHGHEVRAEDLQVPMSELSRKYSIQDLFLFYAKPWFTRLWVLQELVLPPEATLYCGEWSTNRLSIVKAGGALVEIMLSHFPQLQSGRLDWISGYMGAVLGMTALTFIALKHFDASKEPDASNFSLLDTVAANLECSDPRDKFYGRLGLVLWREDRTQFMKWFRVDYSLPASIVAQDATRVHIIQSGTLGSWDKLSRGHSSEMISVSMDASMPSWVSPLRMANKGGGFKMDCFAGYRPMDVALIRDTASDAIILVKGYATSNTMQVFRASRAASIESGANEEVNMGHMIANTIQKLLQGNRLCLIKSMLEILTEGSKSTLETRPFGTASLSTGDCLILLESYGRLCIEQEHAEIIRQRSREGFYMESLGLRLYHHEIMLKLCWERRFFVTSCGKLGLGPSQMEESDLIAVLFGSQYPCVLRSCPRPATPKYDIFDDAEPNCYRFVGLAYIPGIMDGEAVDEKEAAGKEPEIFEIW